MRPRLDELIAQRGQPLTLDLVMVSHIDGDHITGIRKLFRQLEKELASHLPQPIQVKTLWHNTFNDILHDPRDAYYRTFTASFTAGADGTPDPRATSDLEAALRKKQTPNAAHLAFDISSVLASQADGRTLRDSFKALRDANLTGPLNHPIQRNGKPTLVCLDAQVTREAKFDNVSLRVAGPQKAEIDSLQQAFDAYIAREGLSTASLVAAYADKSIPNLSSIVCLATAGRGANERSILFTGDARGDLVLEGLEAAGIIDRGGSLHVDVLKVPHHGSSRNVDQDFFQRITANAYVFSGDGKNGNPDRETLEMLIGSRPQSDVFDIVLTYTPREIDEGAKRDARAKGKTWSKAADSVEDLLTKKSAAGFRFDVVAGAPIRIDLGSDELP